MQHPSTYVLLAVLAAPTLHAQEAPPSIEALWQIIQQQQSELDALKSQNAQTKGQLAETQLQVDATGDALDELNAADSSLASWTENTQIGGYGELHYNKLNAKNSENDVDKIDFHRFVLYFNHQFNNRLRLFTELELEHSLAGENKNGEIELEQAYIQYDLDDQHQLQGGLFLLPIGILNETHEPNTFYGVERNSVEKSIIPTTWWEAGGAINGHYANGLSWDFAITSGLEIGDDYVIRGGRNKVSEAAANDPAYTARLKYTGLPGLELATSYQYQTDANQGNNSNITASQLLETHIVYNNGPFTLRALWAGWKFDGAGIKAAGADDQSGWYVEPAWRFRPGNYDVGIYARYEDVDGHKLKGDSDEFQLGKFDEWQVGVNYWPVANVALKFDYRKRHFDTTLTADNFDFAGIDIGLGYSF